MKNDEETIQPTLFSKIAEKVANEDVILFGLEEFQSRGLRLIDREFALDRLRGAFRRAAEKFGIEEFSDEKTASVLERLGASITSVPSYVAKHPYKVTVNAELAARAFDFYEQTSAEEKSVAGRTAGRI